MRLLVLSSLLFVSGILGLAQDSDQLDKAPPPVEEALRARVDEYYHAFMEGKFKKAYLLVANDSQDAFLESDKQQYKACETIKIRFAESFTKATVVESCKGEWRWHGQITPTTFPVTSSWKIEDGKWCWTYMRPTQVPSPFSPTGFVPVPAENAPKDGVGVPKDFRAATQSILAKVSVDKLGVRLHPDETSHDVVRVRNGMPGVIKLQMDQLAVPGLKITLGKSELGANEETTVSFDYSLDDPGIACIDCAKKLRGTPTVALHVVPTGQTFTIAVAFVPTTPVGNKPPVHAPQQ
jgi:hypothetical protein